jgi:3-phenylpropionate/cinnamic acid dioxygenase small subunit
VEVHHEVEQFYYREAKLLDDRRFAAWLALFTEDTRYWAPVRSNRMLREQDQEFTVEDDGLAYFDDNKVFLESRVLRLATGMAWAEDPPSRTRHLISNVVVQTGTGVGELQVDSSFIVYRNRLETEVDIFAGARDDLLRRTEAGLQIARRTIVFDQNVLLAKNLSIFF